MAASSRKRTKSPPGEEDAGRLGVQGKKCESAHANEPQSTVATPMVEKVGVIGYDFTLANYRGSPPNGGRSNLLFGSDSTVPTYHSRIA